MVTSALFLWAKHLLSIYYRSTGLTLLRHFNIDNNAMRQLQLPSPFTDEETETSESQFSKVMRLVNSKDLSAEAVPKAPHTEPGVRRP